MNPYLLLSFMLSALLTFFAAALLVESSVILFRMQPRTRAFLRLIPILCMILDPIFNAFSWLNPLICNSCVQDFLLKVYFPELATHLATQEISLVNYLAAISPPMPALLLFCIVTAFFLFRALYQVYVQKGFLKGIKGVASKEIANQPLAEALKGVKVVESDQIAIPMASQSIFIPKGMTLSQGEYEAIIAHELEHIKWKDPLLRLILHIISAFFWWVPTGWWLKRMIQDQELACDQSILKYGLQAEYLASSLVKFAKKNREHLCTALVNNYVVVRVKALLGTLERVPKRWGLLGIGVALLCFMMCN